MAEIIVILINISVLFIFGIGGTFFPQKLIDYYIRTSKKNLTKLRLEKFSNQTWWHPKLYQYRIGGVISLIVALWLTYQLILATLRYFEVMQ